jgi:hypothetical protein
MIVYGKVGLVVYRLDVLPRSEVMTMTLVCYLDEVLFGEVCVGYPCVSLSGFW